MKYLICPQCGIPNFYLKSDSGEILLIKVSRKGSIVPKDESANLYAYNTDIIYCLGCSWSGTIKELV